MLNLIAQYAIQAVSAIIIALVGIWVSGLKDKISLLVVNSNEIEKHLKALNGSIVEVKLEQVKSRGEVDVSLSQRPDYSEAHNMIRDHALSCGMRPPRLP